MLYKYNYCIQYSLFVLDSRGSDSYNIYLPVMSLKLSVSTKLSIIWYVSVAFCLSYCILCIL